MYPKSFQKLIDKFAALPSIGPKMAERLVLYLFKEKNEVLQDFSLSLSELKKNLSYCQRCFNLSEEEFCSICKNTKRNQKSICLVEDPLDIFAIEKTRHYLGLYHVLGGVLSPLKNSREPKLRIKELEERIKKEKPEEIILALNPTTEGDATTLYLKNILKKYPLKITTLARGLSTGSDLEYADEITLTSALENRK